MTSHGSEHIIPPNILTIVFIHFTLKSVYINQKTVNYELRYITVYFEVYEYNNEFQLLCFIS